MFLKRHECACIYDDHNEMNGSLKQVSRFFIYGRRSFSKFTWYDLRMFHQMYEYFISFRQNSLISFYTHFIPINDWSHFNKYIFILIKEKQKNVPGYVCNHGSPRERGAASERFRWNAISDIQLGIICVISQNWRQDVRCGWRHRSQKAGAGSDGKGR